MDNCFYFNCIKSNKINDTCIKPIKKQNNIRNKEIEKEGLNLKGFFFVNVFYLYIVIVVIYRLYTIILLLHPICP